jgi:hypothetical protein
LNHPKINESDSEGDYLGSEDEYKVAEQPGLSESAQEDEPDSSLTDVEDEAEYNDEPKMPSKK